MDKRQPAELMDQKTYIYLPLSYMDCKRFRRATDFYSSGTWLMDQVCLLVVPLKVVEADRIFLSRNSKHQGPLPLIAPEEVYRLSARLLIDS